jgi:arylsulfatase A-like enzyme
MGGPKGKHTMYELGFRTPVVFSWPGRIPARETRDDLVSLVDVFATLADVAGVSPPADRTGVSLTPTLESGSPSSRDALIGGMSHLRQPGGAKPAEDRAWFWRDQRWHYLWYEDRQSDALFDVRTDPEERSDLVADHPEVAARARASIEQWRERMRHSIVRARMEAPDV